MILAVMAMGTLSAQTADGIAKKYVEAIGGAKNWKAVKTRKSTISLAQSGVNIPGFIVGDNSNRERLELTFSGMKMVQAYDGTTPWTINQFQGISDPTKLEGEQAKQVSEVAFLDEFIDYKKRGITLNYEGEEDLEGVACYKVKLTKKSGTESVHYFDKESGLQMGSGQMTGGQLSVTHYGDYQEVEGVKMPMKISQKTGIAPFTITIVKVEFNIDVTDDMFAFPSK